MKTVAKFVLGLCLVVGGVSCADSGEFQPYVQAFGRSTLDLGGKSIQVEVAETAAKRAQGLMNRDALPADGGLLFIYADAAIYRFWMKNTFIPLDIAFIDWDGTITNIETMLPMEETPGAVSIKKVPYALEMNQGWFAKHGIQAGSVIEIPEWVTDLAAE